MALPKKDGSTEDVVLTPEEQAAADAQVKADAEKKAADEAEAAAAAEAMQAEADAAGQMAYAEKQAAAEKRNADLLTPVEGKVTVIAQVSDMYHPFKKVYIHKGIPVTLENDSWLQCQLACEKPTLLVEVK